MTPLCKRSLFNVGSANLLLSRFLNDKALFGKLIVAVSHTGAVLAGLMNDPLFELGLNGIAFEIRFAEVNWTKGLFGKALTVRFATG